MYIIYYYSPYLVVCVRHTCIVRPSKFFGGGWSFGPSAQISSPPTPPSPSPLSTTSFPPLHRSPLPPLHHLLPPLHHSHSPSHLVVCVRHTCIVRPSKFFGGGIRHHMVLRVGFTAMVVTSPTRRFAVECVCCVRVQLWIVFFGIGIIPDLPVEIPGNLMWSS